MSGLYTQNFSSATATATARALSPHIRTPPDVESQYLTELLTERQKLGPFVQVLPICNRLLNQEIFRVSGMISNQGLNDYDRLQRGSPSPVSSDIMPNYRGTGLGSWHGLPHDVSIRNFVTSGIAILFLKVFQFLRPLTYLTIVQELIFISFLPNS
ncbi:hypothetical protein L484_022703 [Morus notabilis]|uniref:STAR protein homodimerisation region domain-containing protein n=1 Tax=Morus notabilis TaxID=981085 RepID=W9QXZ6_9ROSA|nr:KH domain-containing protein At3g08620 [Morus notabilis]EXB57596.1 hypothetical protein L484_022703 [Morus notabilis]